MTWLLRSFGTESAFPLSPEALAKLDPNSRLKNQTHLGTEYKPLKTAIEFTFTRTTTSKLQGDLILYNKICF